VTKLSRARHPRACDAGHNPISAPARWLITLRWSMPRAHARRHEVGHEFTDDLGELEPESFSEHQIHALADGIETLQNLVRLLHERRERVRERSGLRYVGSRARRTLRSRTARRQWVRGGRPAYRCRGSAGAVTDRARRLRRRMTFPALTSGSGSELGALEHFLTQHDALPKWRTAAGRACRWVGGLMQLLAMVTESGWQGLSHQ
jgi:hypothetical protein